MSNDDPFRELTNAEMRLVTDISMLIDARDPDGRVGKALEGFLGFDAKADVREILATGELIEAEIHLGEGKVYIEVQRDDEGIDWIIKTEIEDIAHALDDEDRAYLTNSLRRELESKELQVLAGARTGKGWNVVFDVEDRLMAVLLTKKGPLPMTITDKEFRPLAAQLILRRALEIAGSIGPQVELEVLALRRNRSPKGLLLSEANTEGGVPFDPKGECQWVAENVFAETGLVVTIEKLTGSARIETLDPSFD